MWGSSKLLFHLRVGYGPLNDSDVMRFKKGEHFSPSTEFKKGSKVNLGRKREPFSDDWKKKIGLGTQRWHKERNWISPMKNPEISKKVLRRRIPSSLESKMISIVEKLNLPYKFVGDGKFFIESKNPDFIECNGKKIALEVYNKSQKEYFFKGGFEAWKEEREEIFSKYGWKIIFLEDAQINEEEVKKILNDRGV